MLIGATRGGQTIYDQFKSLLVQSGVDPKRLYDSDVFQLLEMGVNIEARLVREGILEQGFSITSKSKEQPKQMIGHGVVNTELANAELAKA